MPQAPVYGGQKANIAAIPGFRQDANRTAQEYGADFGGVVQAAGKLGEEVYVNQSITRAQQEANGLNAELDSDLNSYTQLRGDQARGLSAKASESLQKRIEARRQALQGNPIALKAFERQAPALVNAYTNAVNRHESSQVYAADQATLGTALDRDIETAAKLAGTDGFQSGIDNVERSSIARSIHQGVDPDTAAQQAKLIVPKVKSRSVDMALAENDVAEAKRRFNLLESGMLAEDRSRLKGELDRRTAFIDANAVVSRAFNESLSAAAQENRQLDLTESEVQAVMEKNGVPANAQPHVRAALNEKMQQYQASVKQQLVAQERNIVTVLDTARSAKGVTDASFEFADQLAKSPSLQAWWNRKTLEEKASFAKYVKEGPAFRSDQPTLRDELYRMETDPYYEPSPVGKSAGDYANLVDLWRKKQSGNKKQVEDRINDANAAVRNIIPNEKDREKAQSLSLALQNYATSNPTLGMDELIEKGRAWKDKAPAILIRPRDIPGAIKQIQGAKTASEKRAFADAALEWIDTYRGVRNGGDNKYIDSVAPLIIDGAEKSWDEYKKDASAKYTNPLARDTFAMQLALDYLANKERVDLVSSVSATTDIVPAIVKSVGDIESKAPVGTLSPLGAFSTLYGKRDKEIAEQAAARLKAEGK